MTFVKQDSGGYWVSGPLAVVLLSGMLAAMGYVYQFQDGRLWTDHEDIVQLKSTATQATNETTRLEAAFDGQNRTLTTVLGSIQHLEDAINNLTEQNHDLQKQVADLDTMLRPIHNPSEH